MPWYIILGLGLSLVLGAGMLAFIYFGLIKPGQKDSPVPPTPPAP